MTSSVKWFHFKNSVVEWFKCDSKYLSVFYTIPVFCLASVLFLFNKRVKALALIATLFRTNWYGSYQLPLFFISLFIGKLTKNTKFNLIINEYITSLEQDPAKDHIHKNPERLFESMLIVVKSPSGTDKGVAILKYSYYFPLIIKLFDVNQLTQKYHLVLEPSWAGFLDLSILSYVQFNEPVFVMTYETKDKRLLTQLNTNLVPIDIGPNWWVDESNFNFSSTSERDIDVIVVASWSKFKRHYQILKTLKKVIKTKPDLKICLVGYDGDLSITFIKKMIGAFGLHNNVEIHHKVPTEKVAELFARSKVNILWSRFEGNNRSIIEGFFCDTPVILREGHNFGDHYPYINEQTGLYANEHTLPEKILSILNEDSLFSPREYVMQNHNYKIASKIILQNVTHLKNENNDQELAYKVNLLRGMSYKDLTTNFNCDYKFFASIMKL